MTKSSSKIIGEQAALLSIIEMGLGSFLHGMKIPLSGQYLSLNQIGFMARITDKLNSPRAPLQISIIASLLKSLSPAGKKLTPMLAILSQGFLFSLGPLVFGINLVGIGLGALLSSLWAFIQPVLIIYLLFGKNLLQVSEHFLNELQKVLNFDLKFLLPVLIGFMVFKAFLALTVSYVSIKMSDDDYHRFQEKFLSNKWGKKTTEGHTTVNPLILAMKDLFTPLFILSFFLTAGFFIFSHSSSSTMIWGLLRPVAIGFILFYVIRVYPIEKLALLMEKWGMKNLAAQFRAAVQIVKGHREE